MLEPDIAALIDRISHAAGRALTIHTLTPGDALTLARAAESGSAHALKLMESVRYMIERIQQAEPPALCLTCPTVIRSPRGVTMVLTGAGLDYPGDQAGSAVCPSCAQLPDIDARIMSALEGFWGKLNPVDVHPTAGRA
jgi:hypothetical protein